MTADVALAPRRAVFVDLEGALVDGGEFATGTGPARCRRGVREAFGAIVRAGFTLVVVTTQSGLALGRFSRSQFTLRETLLQQHLKSEAGIDLASFMVCPHRPGVHGSPACLCRRPSPGLLVRAARTQGFDMAASWMVGDSLDDVEAGRRAGCRTVLLENGSGPGSGYASMHASVHGLDRQAPHPPAPEHRVSNLRTPHRRCSDWGEVAEGLLTGWRHAHTVP